VSSDTNRVPPGHHGKNKIKINILRKRMPYRGRYHFIKTSTKRGETRGVSHYALAIYIKKYLKAKEELWKLKYFTTQKI
jgi:hypothetical protein